MNFKLFSSSLIILLLIITGNSCKKTDITVPPVQAHFISAGASYYITNSSNSEFKIPVSLTTVANVDRQVTLNVTSPTNATSGVQYTLGSTTVTIPAGKSVDSVTVKGLFAGYTNGRKDTLIFTITGGDIEPASFNSSFSLVLQKYCDVVLSELEGEYTQSFDAQSPDEYGPYTSSVTAVSTGPTSATLTIRNFAKAAFGPFAASDPAGDPGIKVNIDWTNPANFTTSVPTQTFYKDPSYGTATIKPTGTGTFSSCDGTLTLSYNVTVSAGSFGNFTTTLKR